MARTDRATGIFDTHAQLRAEVQRLMNVRPNLFQADIADRTGVSTGTISTIYKDIRQGDNPLRVDLNKMLDELWRIPATSKREMK
jgi:uncharacterized protein YerC